MSLKMRLSCYNEAGVPRGKTWSNLPVNKTYKVVENETDAAVSEYSLRVTSTSDVTLEILRILL